MVEARAVARAAARAAAKAAVETVAGAKGPCRADMEVVKGAAARAVGLAAARAAVAREAGRAEVKVEEVMAVTMGEAGRGGG